MPTTPLQERIDRTLQLRDIIGEAHQKGDRGTVLRFAPELEKLLVEGREDVQPLELPEEFSIGQKLMRRFTGEDIPDDPFGGERLGGIITGSIAGGVTASRFAPGALKGPAALAGGAFGAATGFAQPELRRRSTERILGQERGLGLGARELAGGAALEAGLDLTAGGAIAVGRLGRKLFTRGFTFTGPASGRVVRETFEDFGIRLNPSDVGGGLAAAGRVVMPATARLPVISTSVSRARGEQKVQVMDALLNLGETLGGPTFRLGAGNPVFSDAALKQIQDVAPELSAKVLDDTNGMFARLTQAFDISVAPTNFLTTAEKIQKQLLGPRRVAKDASGRFTKPTQDTIAGFRPLAEFISENIAGTVPKVRLSELDSVLEGLTDLAARSEPRVQAFIGELIASAAGDMRVAAKGNPALEGLLKQFDAELPGVAAALGNRSVRSAMIKEASQQTSEVMSDTPIPQRAVSTLFDAVFKANNPEEAVRLVDELVGAGGRKGLVSRKELQFLLADRFARAGRNAVEEFPLPGKRATKIKIDAAKFVKEVGLTAPKGSPERVALEKVARESGVGIEKLDRLGAAMNSIFDPATALGDVSTFIVRRVTLGGVRGLTRIITPVAADSSTGILKAMTANATFIMGARAFGKMMTDPHILDLGLSALEFEGRPLLQRQASVKFVRAIMNQFPKDSPERATLEDTINQLTERVPAKPVRVFKGPRSGIRGGVRGGQ